MTHWTEPLFKEQAGRYARFFDERFDDAGPEADALLALVDETCGLDPDRTLDLTLESETLLALAE